MRPAVSHCLRVWEKSYETCCQPMSEGVNTCVYTVVFLVWMA